MVRKALKWLGIGVVGMVGLAVMLLILSPVIFRIVAHVYKGKVEAEIAEIKARGEPVTLADLAGPKIPDSENGAVIYERIFREMKKPQVEKDMDVLLDFFSEQKRSDHPELWGQASVAVQRCHYLIPMIEQAASKPKCRFKVNWQDGFTGFNLPHLSEMWKLGRLLRADVLCSIPKTDTNEVVRATTLGFRLSESLNNEPTLMSQMTRMSLARSASQSLEDAVKAGKVHGSDVQTMTTAVDRVSLEDGLETAFKGERALSLQVFDMTRERPGATLKWAKEPAKGGDWSSKPNKRVSSVWRCMNYKDELFFLSTMKNYIACAHTPYRIIVAKHLNPEPDEFPRFNILSAILLSSPRFHVWDGAKAQLAADRILLGMMVYGDRFGSYPGNLDQLRSKLGWKVPDDPFSGRDFVYKCRGKSFILYSIGSNLKDDGGKEPPKNHEYEGDIVWRMER